MASEIDHHDSPRPRLRGTYRGEWGPWQLLDRVTLTLTHSVTEYEVDLHSCTTSAEVLDWIIQIADKPWGDVETVSGFVQAISALLQPQSTLCPGGVGKSLTVFKLRKQVRDALAYRDRWGPNA